MLSRRRFVLSAATAATAFPLHAQRAHTAPANPVPTPADTALPAPILALADRRPDIHPITPQERAARHDRARELMKEVGIDAILLTTGASLLYFTGAHWYQSERLFCYVLPQAAAPFIMCPALERDHLAELLPHFPEAETTLTYQWNENEDPFTLLRRGFAEVNITTGTVGLDDQVSFSFANAIAHACPSLKLTSGRPVIAGCRSIKSPAELACLRLANQITFDVYRAVYQSCRPGDTAQRVEDLIALAYTRSGVRGEASCNIGPATASPHGSALPQTIHPNEVVTVDDGCTVEGYTSDITRTWVYGKATDEQRKIFDTVRTAQSAALATARPGVEMGAVDAAARKIITDAGFPAHYDVFLHRLGHGIGLDMHESPYLVGGNQAALKPGMTFSDEPGIYLHGKFGIRVEDCMVVTDSGAELFTPQSPSLENPFNGPALT